MARCPQGVCLGAAVLLAVGAGSVAAQSVAAWAPARFAHGTEASARSQIIAERNKMGLVQFCAGQGLIGEDAVTKQRRVLDSLRGAPDLGAEEEMAGRRGVIAFMANQSTFAQSAQAQGITVASKCEQLALGLPG